MLDSIDSIASKIYGMGRVRIESDLEPPGVARRLNKIMDGSEFLSEGLEGEVTTKTLVASRTRPMMSNPYKPVLKATITRTDSGSLVEGDFTLSRWTMVSTLPFFALVGWFGIKVAVGGVTAGRVAGAMTSFAGFAVALLVFVVFIILSMRQARSDAGVIRSRIRKAVGPRI